MAAAEEEVSTSFTVSTKVTIESQPEVPIRVVSYVPATDNLRPKKSKVLPEQMAMSEVEVRTSLMVRLMVTIESQPFMVVKVVS